MNLREDIDQLATTLMPPFEERSQWPPDAIETTDRLFAIIVGMYMANQLTGDQLKNLVEQIDGQRRPSQVAT
jgi:hypothetical protein